MSVVFQGRYTVNGGEGTAAGTVAVTPYGGSTTTSTLDTSGHYSATVAAAGQFLIVETITGAPVRTETIKALDGGTVDTSRDAGTVAAGGVASIPPGTYASAPWTVDIDVFQSILNTGWSTPTSGTMVYGGYNLSAGALNNEMNWDVVLSAGTWTIQLTYYALPNAGIYSVQIDGTEVGTVDGYAGTGAPNTAGLVAGVAITDGKHRVKLKMTGKNASSSAPYGAIQHVQLRRTA